MRRPLLACAALAALCIAATAYTAPEVDGAVFLSTFEEDPFESGQFVKSAVAKYAGQAWELQSHETEGGIPGDKGLAALYPAKHYGIVAAFKQPLVVKDQDLVLQYEVRMTEGLECGGAYIKLLEATEGFDPKKLDSETPYIIMFGPDKCGSTNKVHFILRHRNPVTGAWEEKHMRDAPPIMNDKVTHLYTLVIRKDNSFSVYIDGVSVKDGNLLADMTPAINPEKEIDDPSDVKPSDWVDAAEIPDAAAVKPDDWDEDAPRLIPDMDAVKPEGWLDDAPEFVDDPAAVMPDDWDEEEDGEWEAPQIPNPACEDGPGCGVWSRPNKPNPAYRGKWTRPMIPNPAYIGVWAPRKIPNPAYFVDEHPHNLPAIAGVAVEIWTMSGGLLFDNILVGHDEAAALEFGKKTWQVEFDGLKSTAESAKKAEEKAARLEAFETGTVMDKASYYVLEGVDYASERPIAAIGTLIAVLASMLWCCCAGGSGGGGHAKGTGPTVSDDEEEDETAPTAAPTTAATVTRATRSSTRATQQQAQQAQQGDDEDDADLTESDAEEEVKKAVVDKKKRK